MSRELQEQQLELHQRQMREKYVSTIIDFDTFNNTNTLHLVYRAKILRTGFGERGGYWYYCMP